MSSITFGLDKKPTKRVLVADLTIRKRDGKYSMTLQAQESEEPKLEEELRKTLEAAVKKLNGE
jgi:hypothetical protein